jgi:hypothetical protein
MDWPQKAQESQKGTRHKRHKNHKEKTASDLIIKVLPFPFVIFVPLVAKPLWN